MDFGFLISQPASGPNTMACVLVTEDEMQVRVLAEEILQDLGHTTLSASNFDQALALVEGTDRIGAV